MTPKMTPYRSAVPLTLAALVLLTAPAMVLARACIDPNGDGVVDMDDVDLMIDFQGVDCVPMSTDPMEVEACLYDFNRNGKVGCIDRKMVEANLGPCPCLGDVNEDGVVDDPDLDALELAIFLGVDCSGDLDRNARLTTDDALVYECLFVGSATETEERMDFNDDGVINLIDALDLIDEVLAGGSVDCRSEIVPDGSIDALDRLIVAHRINGGGTCP